MVKIDYDFVYLRTENARMPLKEISKNIKKTPQRLKYTWSVLEKNKIIRDPYCIFDYSYFGLILFRVYFRSAYTKEREKDFVINELFDNPYVVSIHELTGEFDLVVEFISPNPSRFNKELKKIINTYPTLNDYKILLNVVTYVYPRHYLTKKTNLQSIYVERILGGDRVTELFNKNELMVMKNLLNDSTARLTELSKKSNLNIKTVRTILKNLRKRNIIKGFKYILETSSLNLNTSRLFIKLHNLSIEKEAKLMEFLLNTKEIVQVNKTVGDWDIEIGVEAFDQNRVRQLIFQIREEFKELIERFNLIELYKCNKKSYLPQYLFIEKEKVEIVN
ncbi:AsnC family transcriptional regulator [archaeon]|nr:AsnC family transcriptional regulator [archaeon]